ESTEKKAKEDASNLASSFVFWFFSVLSAFSAVNSFGVTAMTTRRQFLQSSLAAGTGLTLTGSASAIEPIRRNDKSHIRLSIAAYSYRQYLNLGAKPKPTMTLDDFIDTAAAMDLDAV